MKKSCIQTNTRKSLQFEFEALNIQNLKYSTLPLYHGYLYSRAPNIAHFPYLNIYKLKDKQLMIRQKSGGILKPQNHHQQSATSGILPQQIQQQTIAREPKTASTKQYNHNTSNTHTHEEKPQNTTGNFAHNLNSGNTMAKHESASQENLHIFNNKPGGKESDDLIEKNEGKAVPPKFSIATNNHSQEREVVGPTSGNQQQSRTARNHHHQTSNHNNKPQHHIIQTSNQQQQLSARHLNGSDNVAASQNLKIQTPSGAMAANSLSKRIAEDAFGGGQQKIPTTTKSRDRYGPPKIQNFTINLQESSPNQPPNFPRSTHQKQTQNFHQPPKFNVNGSYSTGENDFSKNSNSLEKVQLQQAPPQYVQQVQLRQDIGQSGGAVAANASQSQSQQAPAKFSTIQSKQNGHFKRNKIFVVKNNQSLERKKQANNLNVNEGEQNNFNATQHVTNSQGQNKFYNGSSGTGLQSSGHHRTSRKDVVDPVIKKGSNQQTTTSKVSSLEPVLDRQSLTLTAEFSHSKDHHYHNPQQTQQASSLETQQRIGGRDQQNLAKTGNLKDLSATNSSSSKLYLPRKTTNRNPTVSGGTVPLQDNHRRRLQALAQAQLESSIHATSSQDSLEQAGATTTVQKSVKSGSHHVAAFKSSQPSQRQNNFLGNSTTNLNGVSQLVGAGVGASNTGQGVGIANGNQTSRVKVINKKLISMSSSKKTMMGGGRNRFANFNTTQGLTGLVSGEESSIVSGSGQQNQHNSTEELVNANSSALNQSLSNFKATLVKNNEKLSNFGNSNSHQDHNQHSAMHLSRFKKQHHLVETTNITEIDLNKKSTMLSESTDVLNSSNHLLNLSQRPTHHQAHHLNQTTVRANKTQIQPSYVSKAVALQRKEVSGNAHSTIVQQSSHQGPATSHKPNDEGQQIDSLNIRQEISPIRTLPIHNHGHGHGHHHMVVPSKNSNKTVSLKGGQLSTQSGGSNIGNERGAGGLGYRRHQIIQDISSASKTTLEDLSQPNTTTLTTAKKTAVGKAGLQMINGSQSGADNNSLIVGVNNSSGVQSFRRGMHGRQASEKSLHSNMTVQRKDNGTSNNVVGGASSNVNEVIDHQSLSSNKMKQSLSHIRLQPADLTKVFYQSNAPAGVNQNSLSHTASKKSLGGVSYTSGAVTIHNGVAGGQTQKNPSNNFNQQSAGKNQDLYHPQKINNAKNASDVVLQNVISASKSRERTLNNNFGGGKSKNGHNLSLKNQQRLREAAAISQNLNHVPKDASLSNSSTTGSNMMIPQLKVSTATNRRPLVLRKNNFVQARRGVNKMESSADSCESAGVLLKGATVGGGGGGNTTTTNEGTIKKHQMLISQFNTASASNHHKLQSSVKASNMTLISNQSGNKNRDLHNTQRIRGAGNQAPSLASEASLSQTRGQNQHQLGQTLSQINKQISMQHQVQQDQQKTKQSDFASLPPQQRGSTKDLLNIGAGGTTKTTSILAKSSFRQSLNSGLQQNASSADRLSQRGSAAGGPLERNSLTNLKKVADLQQSSQGTKLVKVNHSKKRLDTARRSRIQQMNEKQQISSDTNLGGNQDKNQISAKNLAASSKNNNLNNTLAALAPIQAISGAHVVGTLTTTAGHSSRTIPKLKDFASNQRGGANGVTLASDSQTSAFELKNHKTLNKQLTNLIGNSQQHSKNKHATVSAASVGVQQIQNERSNKNARFNVPSGQQTLGRNALGSTYNTTTTDHITAGPNALLSTSNQQTDLALKSSGAAQKRPVKLFNQNGQKTREGQGGGGQPIGNKGHRNKDSLMQETVAVGTTTLANGSSIFKNSGADLESQNTAINGGTTVSAGGAGQDQQSQSQKGQQPTPQHSARSQKSLTRGQILRKQAQKTAQINHNQNSGGVVMQQIPTLEQTHLESNQKLLPTSSESNIPQKSKNAADNVLRNATTYTKQNIAKLPIKTTASNNHKNAQASKISSQKTQQELENNNGVTSNYSLEKDESHCMNVEKQFDESRQNPNLTEEQESKLDQSMEQKQGKKQTLERVESIKNLHSIVHESGPQDDPSNVKDGQKEQKEPKQQFFDQKSSSQQITPASEDQEPMHPVISSNQSGEIDLQEQAAPAILQSSLTKNEKVSQETQAGNDSQSALVNLVSSQQNEEEEMMSSSEQIQHQITESDARNVFSNANNDHSAHFQDDDTETPHHESQEKEMMQAQQKNSSERHIQIQNGSDESQHHKPNRVVQFGVSSQGDPQVPGSTNQQQTNNNTQHIRQEQMSSTNARILEQQQSQNAKTADTSNRKTVSNQRAYCSSSDARFAKIGTDFSFKTQNSPIEEAKFPMTPQKALVYFQNQLTSHEKREILDYPEIYFVGAPTAQKVQGSPQLEHNYGYDDEKGDYKIVSNDHIGYRFEIQSFLGKGSFGTALKCFDHKTGQEVAVKVVKNKKKYVYQAGVELKILQFLKENDPEDIMNVIHLNDYVIFRKHLCIGFELMSMNLFEFLKINDFQGFDHNLIRRFAIQLLYALKYLKMFQIIHCDLKPENILLKEPNKSGIKIIDFGSSTFLDERVYTYIQSRFYRAPEIMLGIPYDTGIDMWSFGCIMAELYIGYPIFPGDSENDQMSRLIEMVDVPDEATLKVSTRKEKFFKKGLDGSLEPIMMLNSRGRLRKPLGKPLALVIGDEDPDFTDFVTKCLQWDPNKRMCPDQALKHVWVLKGLPPQVLIHHQKMHGIATPELPEDVLKARDEFIAEQRGEMRQAEERQQKAQLQQQKASSQGGSGQRHAKTASEKRPQIQQTSQQMIVQQTPRQQKQSLQQQKQQTSSNKVQQIRKNSEENNVSGSRNPVTTHHNNSGNANNYILTTTKDSSTAASGAGHQQLSSSNINQNVTGISGRQHQITGERKLKIKKISGKNDVQTNFNTVQQHTRNNQFINTTQTSKGGGGGGTNHQNQPYPIQQQMQMQSQQYPGSTKASASNKQLKGGRINFQGIGSRKFQNDGVRGAS